MLQIKQITLELLTIIRQTENDDLTSVMQKIVCTYTEQLMPIAVEICQHLVNIKLLTLLELHDGNVFESQLTGIIFLKIYLLVCK
jgi:Importin, protein involved in nuclear import